MDRTDDSEQLVRILLEDGADETDLENALMALAKAVAAHPSHVQQRSRIGQFVRFNPRRDRPRDAAGRFLKRLNKDEQAEARRLADVERERLGRQLGRNLKYLQEGRIDAREAGKCGAEAIEEYYERLFRNGMQAAGNPAVILTPRDRAAISRIVRDESDYWRAFMEDVAAGRGALDYDERLAIYQTAANEAFWLGWVLGDQRQKRQIRWVLGVTEHCDTCNAMARRGWMTIKEFIRAALVPGYLPQSGYLDCKGIRCKCSLEDKG